ncbi:MAG: hypothetical protein ACQEP1_02535 [Nanobdellota archaeon]
MKGRDEQWNLELRVLVGGEPSIDEIFEVEDHHAPSGDFWNLNEKSYFANVDEHNKEIGKLKVGRKWGVNGERLSRTGKATLTKDDKGLFRKEPLTDEELKKIEDDPDAIGTRRLGEEMGGPARNSIEAAIKIMRNGLIQSYAKPNFHFLLLGGEEESTDKYENHIGTLDNMLSDSGNVDVSFLRDPNWAAHKAFNFVLPDVSRTLIRYQEMRQSFDPSRIAGWFENNHDKIKKYDVCYVNSLKNKDLMKNFASFTEGYEGKIIVAPTTDMFNKDKESTLDLLSKADIVMLNTEEARKIVDGTYSGLKDNGHGSYTDIVAGLTSIVGKENARIYVTNDADSAYLSSKEGDYARIYEMMPRKLDNKGTSINAGDNFQGAVIASELLSGMDEMDKFMFSLDFASYHCLVGDDGDYSQKNFREFTRGRLDYNTYELNLESVPSSREVDMKYSQKSI